VYRIRIKLYLRERSKSQVFSTKKALEKVKKEKLKPRFAAESLPFCFVIRVNGLHRLGEWGNVSSMKYKLGIGVQPIVPYISKYGFLNNLFKPIESSLVES